MRWPIRNQLLAPLLILVLGVVAGSVWAAATSANRAWQRMEQRLRANGHTLEDSGYPLDAKRVLSDIALYSGAQYNLVRKSGPAINSFGHDVVVPLPPPDAVYDEAEQLRLGPPVIVEGKTYRCSGLRLLKKGKGDIVYILYPDDEVRYAVWEATWPVLALGGAVGLAAVVLATFIGRRLSRRVHDLERRTRQIAAGDFSPMPLPPSNDEICDLTRCVNEMAHRLAQLQETKRQSERLHLLGQVSAGLAHQLRNGVTGARLAIQLFAREAEGHTDMAALDVALRQLTMLETNLKRFLDLGNAHTPNPEPCNLAQVVADAVDLLRPQCRHANIELRWQDPAEPAILSADRGQLEQLIFNVLGNAVEAAGPGGWVDVHFLATAKTPSGEDGLSPFVLEIADSGPGPPAAIADRLFEPFVTGKQEGVGLGLAVARQVAEGLGGSITWRRDTDRTCFRIEVPRMASIVPTPIAG
jgi:signal transduction histidine kinase